MLTTQKMPYGVLDSNRKLIRKFSSKEAANDFMAKIAAMHPRHNFTSVNATDRINGSSMFKSDGTIYPNKRRKTETHGNAY